MAETEEKDFINLKFSKYEPPIFKEVKEGNLVLYGKNANDLYPDYLIDLYNRSTTHQAAIRTKMRYVLGGGWTVDTSVMSKGEQAQYMEVLKSVNGAGDSLNDLTNKNGWDKFIIGALAIEVIYAKTGKKWKELNFIPVSNIRALKISETEIKYCYLPNWKGVTKYEAAKTKDDFKEWYPFGSDKGGKSELFYYRDFRPVKSGESDVYAQPSYGAAVPWIEVDARTGVFHLNNIRHNFTVGSMLNLFNGDPTPERRAQILAELKAHFSGENAEETGGVMVAFNKPGTTPATMDRLSAGDQDKLYLQVADFSRNAIMTANDTPQSLVNIPNNNVTYERDTIIKDAEHFDSTFVDPEQTIFERIINHLMVYNGLKPLFRLKKIKPLGIVFSEAMIDKYLPDLMPSLIAEKLGLNLSLARTKLKFSAVEKEDEVETYFTFDMALDESGEPLEDSHYKSLHFAKILDIELSDFDADMISVIQKNPTISVDALAVGLKKPVDVVEKKLARLLEGGVFIGEIGNLKVSKIANNTVKEEDIVLDIQVRYFYEGPNDGKTRDWCKDRLDKQPKKGYTFAELQALKASEANYDGNNFNNRGGFWTRKGTNETTTYCRHKWVAKSVRIK